MTVIRCGLCPMCGEQPGFALSAEQAFCENPDCSALCWDMTKTLDENLTNANAVKLPDVFK